MHFSHSSPTSEHILFGHSLGGLFTAYALLTRPHAFSVFACFGPSLWWDSFAILSRLPAFGERLLGMERKPRAFICVGGKEQEAPTKVPESLGMSLESVRALVATSRMVDAADEFSTSLRNAGVDDVDYVAFADENHGTVIPAAITRGLTFALGEHG